MVIGGDGAESCRSYGERPVHGSRSSRWPYDVSSSVRFSHVLRPILGRFISSGDLKLGRSTQFHTSPSSSIRFPNSFWGDLVQFYASSIRPAADLGQMQALSIRPKCFKSSLPVLKDLDQITSSPIRPFSHFPARFTSHSAHVHPRPAFGALFIDKIT